MHMADQKAPQMQATLGLTGLTSNAMALIAPGAFLWLTFYIQATTGTTAPAMWLGIFGALLLCLATAVAYAEISKLYPGTGSSYYYAEQALLSKDKMFKYARVAKFIVGWGSHLYYWVYPGVMVAVTGVFVGYVVGFLYPNVMSGSNPGPLFMALVAVVFSIFVGWIASKGAGASTAVNLAINIVQISALLVFSVLAIGYRTSHPAGSPAFQYDGQTLATYSYQFATAKTAPRSAMPAARRCPCSTRPASRFPSPSTIPRRTRLAPSYPPLRCFGDCAAQIQLPVHSGHGRHSDSGRLRIGNLDGRRGQKSHQAYSHRRHLLAADPGSGVLPDRVFRGQLLSQLRVHHGKRLHLRGAHRRHDDHRRRRAAGPRQWAVLHAG
jgi:hypothetical protein